MRFIPSPTPIKYALIYAATANPAGRMQYHRILPGKSKLRITRSEFIKAYNDSAIIAIRPLQQPRQDGIFEFEFYV